MSTITKKKSEEGKKFFFRHLVSCVKLSMYASTLQLLLLTLMGHCEQTLQLFLESNFFYDIAFLELFQRERNAITVQKMHTHTLRTPRFDH